MKRNFTEALFYIEDIINPVYGYNIPYLEQDENSEGVKCLRYAI